MSITDLPLELLEMVLQSMGPSDLRAMRLVCKAWDKIVTSASGLKMRNLNVIIPSAEGAMALRLASSLKSIVMDRPTDFNRFAVLCEARETPIVVGIITNDIMSTFFSEALLFYPSLF